MLKIEKLSLSGKQLHDHHLLSSSLDAYEIGCNIGKGTLGLSTLWLSRQKHPTGDLPSLFITRKTDIDLLTTKALDELQGEVLLSSRLAHPNIIKTFISFVQHDCIYTVLPLFNYGSCHDLITAHFQQGLPAMLVAIVVRAVVLALEYLHKLGVIHRALKSSHILINSDGTVCLSGLRYCLSVRTEKPVAHKYPLHAVQMLPWMAPEMLQQNINGYTCSSDIYSLGITAHELATGVIPFIKLRPTEILLQKVQAHPPQLSDSHLSDDASCSQTSLDGLEVDPIVIVHQSQPKRRIRRLNQLVDACLQSDPSARPTAIQLHHCSYIRHIKRKLKEKTCPTFTDLLKPLTVIEKFIPADDGNNHAECQESGIEVQKDADWLF